MTIPEYISAFDKQYKAGITTEYSYLGNLKILRKCSIFPFDDILHYQRVIVALNETVRVMREIDLALEK